MNRYRPLHERRFKTFVSFCSLGKRPISQNSTAFPHRLLLTSTTRQPKRRALTFTFMMSRQNNFLKENKTFHTSSLYSDNYKVAESTNWPQDDKLMVCVEGNIGCGKTTLLNYFESAGGCEVIAEPVEKWRNIDGYNALELMYQDPTRWSMALQTYVQLTMVQNHTKPMTQRVRLMERSIFSAKYCFVDNLYSSGKLPELEYIILTEWFNWILQSQNFKVDLIVYLRTDPELLHERIMSRCREEEKCIPVEYLKCLHDLHEDWLINKKHPCPDVLVLDANKTLEEMKRVYDEHKSRICRTPGDTMKSTTMT